MLLSGYRDAWRLNGLLHVQLLHFGCFLIFIFSLYSCLWELGVAVSLSLRSAIQHELFNLNKKAGFG